MFQSQLSVIPCRKEPSDKSEMVTQLLFGEFFEIIENSDEKWVKIKIHHDNYSCFIDQKQFNEAMETGDTKRNLTPVKDPVYKYVNDKHHLILTAGAMIEGEEKQQNLSLEEYAKQFLDTPYLWGGRTVLGIDCSGYTQLIYRLMGKEIPRDAYQQAEIGTTVSFVEESITGDLAFFDNQEGNITHVGIILRGNENIKIIHASGKVRIDTLDHHGIFNSDINEYSHRLRIIKRLLE